MKKKIFLFGLMCLLLTGCGNVTLKNVIKNLTNAKNYNADVTLKIEGTFNNEEIDFQRDKYIIIDNINSSARVKAVVNQNDNESREVYYLKSNKDIVTTYRMVGEYYESSSESKDLNSIYYITAFINENASYQLVSNERGISKFVITINKDRVKDFLNSYYDIDILNEIDYEISDNLKVYLYIDNNTNNVKTLSADFTDIVKFKNIDSYNLEKFYLEINYSRFNDKDISVEIPSEYISNAVDKEVLDNYIDASNYIEMINNLNLNDVTTYTNTELNYDGVKPSELNFTLVKGKVLSGYIIINDYKFKAQSGKLCEPGEYEMVEKGM